jgi:hypothetical protein
MRSIVEVTALTIMTLVASHDRSFLTAIEVGTVIELGR